MKKSSHLRQGLPDDLPEGIIQHIQSYLSDEDAVRSSLLSKSWRHAQSTLPSLRFHQSRFGLPMVYQPQKHEDNPETKELRQRFVKFVDDTLVRYHNSKLLVQKFDLSVEITGSEFDSHVQRWLGLVSREGLKQLSLTAMTNDNICLIPFEIFSCEALQTLKIRVEGWGEGERLRCPCNPRIGCFLLQVLELHRVRITDKLIDELISNCPLLEEITLCDCDGFGEIHIRDLQRLRIFYISTLNEELVEIDAPSLRSFTYSGDEELQRPCSFNIDASTSLTHLQLRGVTMKDTFFKKFISKFPLLELLNISGNDELQGIDIACPNLTELSTMFCPGLEYVKVDAPKLVFFNYMGKPVPSLDFPGVDADQLKANIDLDEYDELEDHDSYFLWLSRVLHISRNMSVQLNIADFPMNEMDLLPDLRGNDTRLLHNVKELYVWLADDEHSHDSMYYLTIMDALFTICHPRYIRTNRFDEEFCNFLLMELMDRRTLSSCNFITNVEVSLTNKAGNHDYEEDDAKLLKVPWRNLIHGSTQHNEYKFIRFTITWSW